MCEGEHGKNHIQFFVKNFCNVKFLVECCYWLPRAGGITSCTNNNVWFIYLKSQTLIYYFSYLIYWSTIHTLNSSFTSVFSMFSIINQGWTPELMVLRKALCCTGIRSSMIRMCPSIKTWCTREWWTRVRVVMQGWNKDTPKPVHTQRWQQHCYWQKDARNNFLHFMNLCEIIECIVSIVQSQRQHLTLNSGRCVSHAGITKIKPNEHLQTLLYLFKSNLNIEGHCRVDRWINLFKVENHSLYRTQLWVRKIILGQNCFKSNVSSDYFW